MAAKIASSSMSERNDSWSCVSTERLNAISAQRTSFAASANAACANPRVTNSSINLFIDFPRIVNNQVNSSARGVHMLTPVDCDTSAAALYRVFCQET